MLTIRIRLHLVGILSAFSDFGHFNPLTIAFGQLEFQAGTRRGSGPAPQPRVCAEDRFDVSSSAYVLYPRGLEISRAAEKEDTHMGI